MILQVHFAATQAAIRVHFGRCGNINRVMLLVEAGTGKPKGCVLVPIIEAISLLYISQEHMLHVIHKSVPLNQCL